MWGPREGVQDELHSFLAQEPGDVEAPSREPGCRERLEAGESRYEQAGAQHPVGHPGGQDARHPAGTREETFRRFLPEASLSPEGGRREH